MGTHDSFNLNFAKPSEQVVPEFVPEVKTFSVSEVNRMVRDWIREGFPSFIWVEGEVSRVKIHSSGHMYFVLKDENASVSAVMFRSARSRLKFELKHGMQVLCLVRVDLYEREGKFQFYIEDIHPKGIGALELAFRQLKEKLEKEGLFREELKRPIPYLPRTVGVITSPTGAAIRDIIKVISRRFPGVNILLYPVRVQGEGACDEIARAIDDINEHFADEVDVLIVGRGGGSIEDLWAFNEEVVARAISRSKIPIISAVGHEIDFTIADFVADKRAPTPSAGAELAVPDRGELISHLNHLLSRLLLILRHRWDDVKWRIERIGKSRAFLEPKYKLEQRVQLLDSLLEKMAVELCNRLDKSRLQLKHLAGKLDVLSPLRTLARGYAIVYKEKRVVRLSTQLSVRDRVTIRFADGEVNAEVVKDGKNNERQQYLF